MVTTFMLSSTFLSIPNQAALCSLIIHPSCIQPLIRKNMVDKIVIWIIRTYPKVPKDFFVSLNFFERFKQNGCGDTSVIWEWHYDPWAPPARLRRMRCEAGSFRTGEGNDRITNWAERIPDIEFPSNYEKNDLIPNYKNDPDITRKTKGAESK